MYYDCDSLMSLISLFISVFLIIVCVLAGFFVGKHYVYNNIDSFSTEVTTVINSQRSL